MTDEFARSVIRSPSITCKTFILQSSAVVSPAFLSRRTIGHSRRVVYSIHRRKTGAMIRVSLRLGAMLAGATREQRAALYMYGDCLGLAFQITDDLLDVQGT